MTLLQQLFGDYTYHFILISSAFPQMLFATLLFASSMERRSKYPLRLAFSVLVCTVINVLLSVLRTRQETIYSRILVYFLTNYEMLPLLLFCYRESTVNTLLNWCAAVVSQDIAARLFSLLISLAGNDSRSTISFLHGSTITDLDWLILYTLEFAIILVLFLFFRQSKCLNTDKKALGTSTRLSIITATWMMLIHAFSREYMQESSTLYMTVNVCCLSFSMVVLLLRNGILSENQYRQEIAMTETLLKEERMLYDSIKGNIDLVNMRCHDLKHQLEDLSYKLTEEELVRLKQAIRIYDNSIKTGSEVLDVVIYEKQLIFDKEGIRFTVMADGSCLSFMRTTHAYALFSNALGNALEAVRKLSNPEMRIIELTVQRAGCEVEISVSNYFDGTLPSSTSKADSARHGFGLRSMTYIASQYGGNLTTKISGQIFELVCRIPIPESAVPASQSTPSDSCTNEKEDSYGHQHCNRRG